MEISFPPESLLITSGDLQLRLPTRDQLNELAQLSAGGIHEPAEMPFAFPWTDQAPELRARSTLQHYWATLGSMTPERWRLVFVVIKDGAVVGTQNIAAENFAICREVHTGSWLGLPHQGQGTGTAMRRAVLDLAFHGLGAAWATSGAFDDNPSSLAVSRKLGYREDGTEFLVRRGQSARLIRLRLSRADWLAQPHQPARIAGLEPCLPLLGATTPTRS